MRGVPVVNDVIAADARQAGIDRWAQILSNGDDALGTILSRTSPSFRRFTAKWTFCYAKDRPIMNVWWINLERTAIS